MMRATLKFKDIMKLRYIIFVGVMLLWTASLIIITPAASPQFYPLPQPEYFYKLLLLVISSIVFSSYSAYLGIRDISARSRARDLHRAS